VNRTGDHHRGNYQTNAKRLMAAINSSPGAVCWRCGLMLQQHKAHRSGRPPFWTAGHTIDASTTAEPWLTVTVRPPPGDWLAPEASVCNYAAGNRSKQASPTAPTVAPVTTRRW